MNLDAFEVEHPVAYVVAMVALLLALVVIGVALAAVAW